MADGKRFDGVTTRQLCYLLKDAKKLTADEYPEWRQEAARQDCVAIEAECVRRDAELAQLRAELAALKPLAEAAVRLGQTPEPGVAYSLDDITGRVKAECDTLWAARAYAAQAGEGA